MERAMKRIKSKQSQLPAEDLCMIKSVVGGGTPRTLAIAEELSAVQSYCREDRHSSLNIGSLFPSERLYTHIHTNSYGHLLNSGGY